MNQEDASARERLKAELRAIELWDANCRKGNFGPVEMMAFRARQTRKKQIEVALGDTGDGRPPNVVIAVADDSEERLRSLCRQAIEEQDLEKVLEIAWQIDQKLVVRFLFGG